MSGLIERIRKLFNPKLKFVFDAHSARVFVNGGQVPTELLFDIDTAIKDFQRFEERFKKECRRVALSHLGRAAIMKPLLILEVNWDLAQSREFQDMLIDRVQAPDFNAAYRQICLKINGKLFLHRSGKGLKEVPAANYKFFDD